MRAGIATSISVVAVLILCASCGKPVPSGSWRGERNLPVNPGTDPFVADQLRRIKLTIAEDGKADLEDGGVPFEGQMSRKGDRLTFEVLAVSGRNISKQPADMARSLSFDLKGEALMFGETRLDPVR